MAATPAHPSAPDRPPVSQPHAGPSGRPIQPAPPHLAAARAPSADSATDDGGARKRAKRRKVNHACLYCRRSHMTCDEGRPCQRCIKREIGHLCHDEPRAGGSGGMSKPVDKPPVPVVDTTGASINAPPRLVRVAPALAPALAPAPAPAPALPPAPAPMPPPAQAWPASAVTPTALLYPPETLRTEFAVLTDFLETLDERAFFGAPAPSTVMAAPVFPAEEVLPAATKTERFLLTAADQEDGSRDERLNRVIRSKYEAGLLRPYNYVTGYARLSRWMDTHVSQASKQAILQPLSILRPKFRAIAQALTDMDHVVVEEAFERMLLDYDRVFAAMGIPACLWRRTGEIVKANREFAELLGIDAALLRDGRLCIYELMAEESAVNYWEKYGHVAFDSAQKAVLTSCVLRHRPSVAAEGADPPAPDTQDGFISCCFSITIRRDAWGIPSMIVGNFIRLY